MNPVRDIIMILRQRAVRPKRNFIYGEYIRNKISNGMKNGFGFLGIIILSAVIASVAFGGGMYWSETKKQQSLLQTGADAVKRAEELKQSIESREESIYGGRTSIDSEVDTSTWKIYRNEEYGFEMKYPNDWIFSQEDSGGILYEPGTKIPIDEGYLPPGITIGISKRPNGISFDDFVRTFQGGWYLNYEIKRNILLGGKKSVIFNDSNIVNGQIQVLAAFIDASEDNVFMFFGQSPRTKDIFYSVIHSLVFIL